jgi:hypothetical protein
MPKPDVLTQFVNLLSKKDKPEKTLLCSRFEDLDKLSHSKQSTKRQYKNLFKLKEEQIDKYLFFNDLLNEQKTIDGQYDLIIADLPINIRDRYECLNGNYRGELCAVAQLAKGLRDSGKLLTVLTPSMFYSTLNKPFLEDFKRAGYYPSGVFQLPEKALWPTTSIQPIMVIFSKKEYNKIFVAKLAEDVDVSILVDNFFSRNQSDNLYEGQLISENDFKSFERLDFENQIKNLRTQFKEYKKVPLDELVIEYKHGLKKDLDQANNSLYLPGIPKHKLGPVLRLGKLTENKTKFIQLKLKPDKISAQYLKMFFTTELGQLILNSASLGATISRIRLSDFRKLSIPVPPIDEQKLIAKANKRLERLLYEIQDIQKDLSLNPKNAKELMGLTEGLLKNLDALSAADRIRELVRKGESKVVEFKQTFLLNIHTNKKDEDIETGALKNIVAFLNAKGGTLLIGVTDNGEIAGLKKDRFGDKDSYKLHFTNKVKERVGEQNYALIDYEIVDVGDKLVLRVDCQPSDEPVFLDDKDFYVRTNPSANKLQGSKQIEYIKKRFK